MVTDFKNKYKALYLASAIIYSANLFLITFSGLSTTTGTLQIDPETTVPWILFDLLLLFPFDVIALIAAISLSALLPTISWVLEMIIKSKTKNFSRRQNYMTVLLPALTAQLFVIDPLTALIFNINYLPIDPTIDARIIPYIFALVLLVPYMIAGFIIVKKLSNKPG